MKYVIVLCDGAADEPLEDLDGRTPLQAAAKMCIRDRKSSVTFTAWT